MSLVCKICFWVGFTYILTLLIDLVYEIYSKYFVKLDKNLILNKFGEKSYVLITGSSDGIGLGFADLFGKLGFNLILWSRTQSKLERVRSDLLTKYPEIDIRIVAKDFSRSMEEAFYADELNKLDQLDVSILVNNVGFLSECAKFGDFKVAWLVNSVNVNMIPHAVLSAHFLKKFKLRSKESAFIDLSSIISELAVSFYNIYGASKQFNTYFTQSLFNLHSVNPNLKCISVLPGPVHSKMSETINKLISGGKPSKMLTLMRKILYSTPSGTSLESLKGLLLKRRSTTGSVNHAVLRFLIGILLVVYPFWLDISAYFRNLKKFNKFVSVND